MEGYGYRRKKDNTPEGMVMGNYNEMPPLASVKEAPLIASTDINEVKEDCHGAILWLLGC